MKSKNTKEKKNSVSNKKQRRECVCEEEEKEGSLSNQIQKRQCMYKDQETECLLSNKRESICKEVQQSCVVSPENIFTEFQNMITSFYGDYVLLFFHSFTIDYRWEDYTF